MLRSCQTLECCVDVTPLGRTVYTAFTVDACNQSLTVEIEKYRHTVSLVNYDFGVQDQVWLHNIIKMK